MEKQRCLTSESIRTEIVEDEFIVVEVFVIMGLSPESLEEGMEEAINRSEPKLEVGEMLFAMIERR